MFAVTATETQRSQRPYACARVGAHLPVWSLFERFAARWCIAKPMRPKLPC